MERKGDWMLTFTGKRFWPLDPRPEDIDVLDIAHGLANTCRFSGQVRHFYSVAEHSVYVALACPEPLEALYGLLHDASEAYVCDIPRPLKRQPEMAAYVDLEAGIMRAVWERFGLNGEMPACVHAADGDICKAERRDLMPPGHWFAGEPETNVRIRRPLGPEAAEYWWLANFHRLLLERF